MPQRLANHAITYATIYTIAITTGGIPGAIQTDFSVGMVRDNPEFNTRVAVMTALGRAGVPDDIGLMAAALLSDENPWVNGERIEAKGGMML
jgi:NAD(P)-dependent dehydrogenase (short-subunit alcohol dehydrogenase family)